MARAIGITGVTGFIGSRLAARALERGDRVVGLARRAWRGAPHVPLADRSFLEIPARPDPEGLRGLDAVVHLAAADQGVSLRAARAVNVYGTRLLRESAAVAGVRRFIFVSSQSAHEEALSGYGRSKFEAERMLSGDPNVVVVRPGLVYDDADGGLLGRAVTIARRLRILPVIGGAAARAQLIHVDDLCDALLRLVDADTPPPLVQLADPTVRPLARAISETARARHGARVLAIPIPLAPVRAVLGALERARVPAPVRVDNLDGIRAFRPMETANDLAALGITLRPFPTTTPSGVPPTAGPEPRRLLLVGAGRIGLVHALTAMHHLDMTLAGIVDRDAAAFRRVRALLGADIPTHRDLDASLRSVRPDAAIVATPPSTHVPLTRRIVESGADALVEKPVCPDAEARNALERLIAERPDAVVSSGYLTAVLPHLEPFGERFRRGEFGAPRSFSGRAYVTRFAGGAGEGTSPWETDPAISGGGALPNVGVHVLAILDAFLGPLQMDEARLVARDGRAVEDGAWLRLSAAGATGELVCAWHLPGFDMVENSVRIVTDRGRVLATTTIAAFLGDDGRVEFLHQIEADAGFDLAPQDAGGGIWNEQRLLAGRVRGGNDLRLAERVESLIRGAYAVASRRPARAPDPDPEPGPGAAARPRLRIDLRSADARVREHALRAGLADGGVVLGSPETPTDRALLANPGASVVLPDIPGLFRTQSNLGSLALLRRLGMANLFRAGLSVRLPRVVSAHGRIWEALLALLRAELGRVPREFAGCLLIDAYLVDLATAVGRADLLPRALSALRRHAPRARVGLEVNAAARLAPQLAVVAEELDVLLVLASGRPECFGALEEARDACCDRAVEIQAKTGPLPPELLALAWREPERWRAGRETLAVGWAGVPGLATAWESRLAVAARSAGRPDR